MKKLLVVLAVAAIFLPLAGCGKKTHEAVMTDMITATKDMVTVLEGIKDKDTAKAAVPKLQEITKRFQEIKKQAEALGEPDEATKKKLEEKLKEFMEVGLKMGTEMMRIQGIPDAATELQSIQKELESIK